MVTVQFSGFTVKLVSFVAWIESSVMDTSAWQGGGRWRVMKWWREWGWGLLDEVEREAMRFWAPEVVECRQEPEMIPRNKSFSLKVCSLTCTSTLRCQIIQLMEDNKDSGDGISRFSTFFQMFCQLGSWKLKIIVVLQIQTTGARRKDSVWWRFLQIHVSLLRYCTSRHHWVCVCVTRTIQLWLWVCL